MHESVNNVKLYEHDDKYSLTRKDIIGNNSGGKDLYREVMVEIF